LDQRRGTVAAAGQRYLALGGPTPHEDGDMLHGAASARIPRRLISHSSSTPLAARTRRRTSSPRSSSSAAVASPVLIRKLQCLSETCAPPRRRPRQPAASISCQALAP